MANEQKDAAEKISQAASLLASIKSPARAERSRKNGSMSNGRPPGTGKPLSEATREKQSIGQKNRRAREAQEKAEANQTGEERTSRNLAGFIAGNERNDR